VPTQDHCRHLLGSGGAGGLEAAASEPTRTLKRLVDIYIAEKQWEEHLDWIKKVANRLSEANLTINTTKSKFCQREIKYLGYILSGDGLRPDPAKVSGIINY
jgi:hypothetical protein